MSANTEAPVPVDPKASLEVQKLQTDIRKADADREKAAYELRALKHWWRAPATLQLYAAIVLTVGAGLIGWYNDWFAIKQQAITNQIHDLQDRRSALNTQIARLTKERDEARQALAEAAVQARQLARQLALLKPLAASAQQYRTRLSALQQTLEELNRKAAYAAGPMQSVAAPATATASPTPDLRIPIQGVVTTETRVPLSGVQVWAEGKGSIGTMQGTTGLTKQNGSFSFVLSSRYIGDVAAINFRKQGFADVRLPITGNTDYSSLAHLVIRLRTDTAR